MTSANLATMDALYGLVDWSEPLASLIQIPMVQRLRHVRLSNIDSLDMPGIANISRYEHVLGVARLAELVPFRSKLSKFDNVLLLASALLHDWAITAYGHLVEEALQYVGTGFDHEERLHELASNLAPDQIGGVGMQILAGRETGLVKWARAVVGPREATRLVEEISDHIKGRGLFGRVISGDIDLDNIDNVYRMAYHLGLNVDRQEPQRLAKAIVDFCRDTGDPIFRKDAETNLQRWRETRAMVYQNLMLAPHDFAGKLMMLFAVTTAYENGEIAKSEWSLTDTELIHRLTASPTAAVKDSSLRWLAGELWNCSPLEWMSGNRPDYADLRLFSNQLSSKLNRTCFAYAIKDKRDRCLSVRFDDGSTKTLGSNSRQWLFGVGSPDRRPFSADEIGTTFRLAFSSFDTRPIGVASSDPQLSLI
ncbi:hypothetical protein [Hyphomicrobium sp.]|uniref:HD domain-containing protein n=1 Tax=Hyphomicrobium sp. TaxID=82 RepID=UPI000F9FF124|nr:hypothetical protein [Hyphomicrobium sp.]RUP08603.1 MAG: hypothetical protein EKK38_12670 [Hyphomicrobium sp.]